MASSTHGPLIAPPLAAAREVRARDERVISSPVLSITTLVLWVVCGTVGWLGLILSYPTPHGPPIAQEPVLAEVLHVDLSDNPAPPADAAPLPEPLQPPPPMDAFVPPDAPPLTPVAQLTPAIAFPLPVEGPTRIVEPKHASHARTAPSATAADRPIATTTRHLVFGQGAGSQPKPDYPRSALIARQQGSVKVKMTVDASGNILSAEVAEPSRWPLLNQEALRTVRSRWHLPPGSPGPYDVTIHFEIP